MRNGSHRAVGVSFVCLLLLGMGMVIIPTGMAAASTVEPVLVEGNATCGGLDPSWVEFHKVEPVGESGVWPAVDADMWVAWNSYEVDEGGAFDWSSNFAISGVFVKGGPNGYLYRYSPGLLADVGLHAPENDSGGWAGLSHISFCYVPDDDRGSITVQKVAEEQGSFLFRFYDHEGLLFDAPVIDSSSGKTWSGLEPGNYSIHEILSVSQLANGWEFVSLLCRSGSGVDEARFPGQFDPLDMPGAFGYGVELQLDVAEHITCVFTNALDGPSVKVVKKANQPGSFEFTLLPGSSASVPVQTGDSHTWTGLTGGETKYTLSETIPAGWSLVEAYCDSEFVWTDNYVEFYLGEADVTCTFTNYKPTNGTTTTTTTAPPVLGEIGDFVWEDPTANGIQEPGEKGVPDVQVQLFKGGSLVATSLTDALGKYKFGGLAAGVYEVQFVLPAGFEFTLANENGDDAADSDADPITGKTGGITLVAGEIDHTWDAGIFRPAQVLPQVVTTTTTPEVLPFTGPPDTPSLVGLAASLVALGGMALISMKRREDQPAAGWSRRLPEVG